MRSTSLEQVSWDSTWPRRRDGSTESSLETLPAEQGPDQPIDELLGRHGYHLEGRLGEGGMGRVYLAVHRASGRRVAVKAPKAIVRESGRARRLLHEAMVVAQLGHPAIVQLLDLVREDDGRLILVFELVEGADLDDWADNPPSWETVGATIRQLLDGLAAAHAAGVIHADLKPSNLLIGNDRNLRVTDFGVSRLVDPLTGDHVAPGLGGTPVYMAPEQYTRPELVGPWSDLYAVGVLLHEWTTGSLPEGWEAHSLRALAAAKEIPVEPPQLRRDDLPRDLPKLISRLLHPDPRQRPRFAAEVSRVMARLPGVPAPTADWEAGPSSRTASHLRKNSRLEGGRNLLRMKPAPLVGRREERNQLWSAATYVCQSGNPQAMFWTGDAGVGKSRIARWVLAEVERTGLMEGLAVGYDVSGSGGPVERGLRAAFRRILGHNHDGGPEWPLDWSWLSSDGQPRPFDAEAMKAWLQGVALTPMEVADLTHGALRAVARTRPILLWLDDVGWAEDGALELVDRVMSDGFGIFVVGTLRTGTAEHPRWRGHSDRWQRHGHPVSFHRLGPMDVIDLERLASEVAEIAPKLAARLAMNAAGRPLVLLQAIYHLADMFEHGPGGLSLPSSLQSTAGLQEPLRVILARRVELFLEKAEDPTITLEVLLIAALVGETFEDAPLVAAMDHVHPGVVSAVIDRALFFGLLRSDDDGHGVRFEHSLLHEHFLELIGDREDRNLFYERAADGLESAYRVSRPAVGTAVAGLYRRAGRQLKAARVLSETGRGLARARTFKEARAAASLAHHWREEEPENELWEAVAVHINGLIAFHQHDFGFGDACARSAERTYRRCGDEVSASLAVLLQASIAFQTGRLREAEALSQIALTEAATGDPLVQRLGLHAHSRLADLAMLREDFGDALAHWREAARFAKGLDPQYEWIVTSLQAELLAITEDPDEAELTFRSVLEDTREGEEPNELQRDFREVEARLAYLRGDVSAAQAWLVATERERRDPGMQSEYLALAVCVALKLREPLSSLVLRMLLAFEEAPPTSPFSVWAMSRIARELRIVDPELAARVESFRRDRRKAIRAGFALLPRERS